MVIDRPDQFLFFLRIFQLLPMGSWIGLVFFLGQLGFWVAPVSGYQLDQFVHRPLHRGSLGLQLNRGTG